MTMSIAAISAVLLVCTLTAGQDPAALSRDTTEATLIANERALQTALATHDKSAFGALVVPDGVWTTQSGFVPMKLLVNGLDSFQLASWDIVNPHVTRLDENSAIVLYAWTRAGTFGDQQLTRTALASTVWTRRSGGWVAAHHQDTDVIQN